MMRKTIFALALALATLSLHAQQSINAPATSGAPTSPAVAPAGPLFGYFSYQTVMEQMPDYAIAQKNIAALRDKYQAEMQRVESEFNAKYEQFLDGQRDFAPSILQKRQTELQDLMQKNEAFKQEAQRLLAKAEEDAMAPVKQKLNVAVQRVGQNINLAFIINTDNNTLPFGQNLAISKS